MVRLMEENEAREAFMTLTIDLNCDLGESFGVYEIGCDREIIQYVTSINIACGFHAGDPSVMNETVKLAKKHNVAIGAHPGFQDLIGFGRRKIHMTSKEIYGLVLYQIGSLYSFCQANDVPLKHVKPHGALYNMAAVDSSVAHAIAKAVYDFDKRLFLYGLAGSELIKQGEKIGLQTVSEVFADRTYQKDGTLTPRTNSYALIEHIDEVKNQILSIIFDQRVKTVDGTFIRLNGESICIHGDGQHALSFAKHLKDLLILEGVHLKSPTYI